MKWISSLDEILYEVASWLLFFPLTLYRAVVRPLVMMEYADEQLLLPQEDQYSAALSPPLFLALSLLLSHSFSMALGQSDAIIADTRGLAGLVNDQASELALRIVVFAGFSLFAATRLVRVRGLPIDRKSLQTPFYAQCYPTAIFALFMGIGISLMIIPGTATITAGAVIAVASIVNYFVIQMRWFRKNLGIGYLRSFGHVVIFLIESITLLVIVCILLSR